MIDAEKGGGGGIKRETSWKHLGVSEKLEASFPHVALRPSISWEEQEVKLQAEKQRTRGISRDFGQRRRPSRKKIGRISLTNFKRPPVLVTRREEENSEEDS